MKIIGDIRFYASNVPNVDGAPFPAALPSRETHVAVYRVVMKLRERRFSLGAFDHLYLNFTDCLPQGTSQLARRAVDRDHPWYRFYDVGVAHIDDACILHMVKEVLLQHFAAGEEPRATIEEAFSAAIEQGENMCMLFKEKRSANRRARIYLRYFDDTRYHPLLCVDDVQGRQILAVDLPPTEIDLVPLGEIQLSAQRVVILPRKGAGTRGLTPMAFSLDVADH